MGREVMVIKDDEEQFFDRFLADAPKGHILQSFAWGEVKKRTGWKPFRLMLLEDGHAVGAISLLKRDIPFIKRSIFYAPRGPVLADMHNEDLWRWLLDEVRRLAGREGAILWKIDPAISDHDTDLLTLMANLGFRPATDTGGFEGTQPRHVFRLSLCRDLDDIFDAFKAKTRYNIRLAAKRGVTIRRECSREDMMVFYEILLETAVRDEFFVRSYGYFEVLWDELVARDYAKLFLAEYQGEVIAGALAFIFGDKAWYIYGASANRQRNVMPNYLLQWTMVQWAKEQGCILYDFRGTPGNDDPDNPLYGLYRFKTGFGGDLTAFVGEFDLVFQPAYYWWWRHVEPVYYRSVRLFLNLKKSLRRTTAI